MSDYTYADLKVELNDMLHNKLGSVSNLRSVLNRSIRSNNSKIDFRSTKRIVGEPTGFFNSIYEIPAPSDMKSTAIIDLGSIRSRSSSEDWVKTSPEEFKRRKDESEEFLFAVEEDSRYKKVLVNNFGDSSKVILSACDALTGDSVGTWAASGDASGLQLDQWNYLDGTGALNFDTASSANPAYLTNSTFTAVDLTNYVDKSSIFISLYIPSANAATYLTSVELRWGTDASNYYSRTVTTTNSTNPFMKGWNILSFQWLGATETGTVTDTSIGYLRIALNKPADIVATSDWRVDEIVAVQGDLHNVEYYSNSYWKSSAGTYLENSTADTDILVADEDERDIHLYQCAINCAQILRERDDAAYFLAMYQDKRSDYQKTYKSEKKPLVSEYYKFKDI